MLEDRASKNTTHILQICVVPTVAVRVALGSTRCAPRGDLRGPSRTDLHHRFGFVQSTYLYSIRRRYYTDGRPQITITICADVIYQSLIPLSALFYQELLFHHIFGDALPACTTTRGRFILRGLFPPSVAPEEHCVAFSSGATGVRAGREVYY